MAPFQHQFDYEYLTHDDPDHTHLYSHCKYDNCAKCECDEVEEMETHCRHCYHCLACSSAVYIGCRVCTFSPDKSQYRLYAGALNRKKCPGETLDHDCDMQVKGKWDPSRWCWCQEGAEQSRRGDRSEGKQEESNAAPRSPPHRSSEAVLNNSPKHPEGSSPQSRPLSGPWSVPDDVGCGNRFIDGFIATVPPKNRDTSYTTTTAS